MTEAESLGGRLSSELVESAWGLLNLLPALKNTIVSSLHQLAQDNGGQQGISPCAERKNGMAMSFQMTTRTFAGVLIVDCSGRLVLGEESANLRHLVRDHLSEYRQVVIDLGNVSYIDSSGLGVLVALYTTAQKAGGAIKLARLNPFLKGMLQITRVFTVFEVFDRAEDAATSFNTNAGQNAPGEWPLDN